jgi:hypothetical protein
MKPRLRLLAAPSLLLACLACADRKPNIDPLAAFYALPECAE